MQTDFKDQSSPQGAPLLSVILPCYNMERWLCECLDSILSQDFSDFEAVCVDDGSTDGTAGLLASYAVRDGRVRVVTQENAGQSEARNTGLRTARGTYVWFVDPDDWLSPGCMKEIVSLMQENDLDLLHFDEVHVRESEDFRVMHPNRDRGFPYGEIHGGGVLVLPKSRAEGFPRGGVAVLPEARHAA